MDNIKNNLNFSVLISVKGANPNGDPANANMPRVETQADGRDYGIITAECIKRKIRNRLQDTGHKIFVQSDDRCDDGCDSLQARTEANEPLLEALKDRDADRATEIACKEWIDVRCFGNLFAFGKDDKSKDDDKDKDEKKTKGKGISCGVKCAISISDARTVSPIDPITMQITKSVNGDKGVQGKDSSTFGSRHIVDFGLYVFHGTATALRANKNGMSEEDFEVIKDAIAHMFDNDYSSARPAGTIEVRKIYWWHSDEAHTCRPAQLQGALHFNLKDGVTVPKSFEDYDITCDTPNGASPEVIEL